MDIQRAVSEIQSFSGLIPIAERAEVKLSWWGSQYLIVSGYEGTLDIDALASRTMGSLRQTNYEFEEAERQPGRRLAARIDRLYEEGDKQFREASCLTKTLAIIRDCFSSISDLFHRLTGGGLPVRFKWQQQESCLPNDDFDHYTEAQLQRVFGMSADEADNTPGIGRLTKNGIRLWQIPLGTSDTIRPRRVV